mmetsp:Transcript_18013/g.59165  ORF Transcript_18013/g.59165 Transcript_18013/m.59165 type:complete len:306 (+) Transcript_18013:40-957(+)
MSDKDWQEKLRMVQHKMVSLWENQIEPAIRRMQRKEGKSYAYILGVMVLMIWYLFSHDFLYFVSLLAEVLRTFGIVLLVLRVVKKTQSVQGLSLKTQQLYAAVFLTRLMFKIAYEQDYLYAFIETIATGLTCYLVFLMRIQYKASYQEENDGFNDLYIIGACGVIGLFLHPNVTSNWFINVLWAFSTYLEAVALLPQLYVFHSASKTVDNMTSLWIVSLFLSRVLECSFWFVALFFRGYMKIWSSIVWYVIITELVHTFLLLDFVRNFYKCYQQGMNMLLPSAWGLTGKDWSFGSGTGAMNERRD